MGRKIKKREILRHTQKKRMILNYKGIDPFWSSYYDLSLLYCSSSNKKEKKKMGDNKESTEDQQQSSPERRHYSPGYQQVDLPWALKPTLNKKLVVKEMPIELYLSLEWKGVISDRSSQFVAPREMASSVRLSASWTLAGLWGCRKGASREKPSGLRAKNQA